MASMARTLDGRTISDTDEPDPREPPVERRESPTVSCDLAGNAYSPWSSMPIRAARQAAGFRAPLLKGTELSARLRIVGGGWSTSAKPKAVGQKRGHEQAVHRLLLSGGQLQVFGNQERLPVQRRGALEPLEVVDLVGRVLIDDEEVVAQGAEDETEVELTDDCHLAKVLPSKHPLELAGGCLVTPLVQRGARGPPPPRHDSRPTSSPSSSATISRAGPRSTPNEAAAYFDEPSGANRREMNRRDDPPPLFLPLPDERVG